MEAARIFKRDMYRELGGYDESMVSGEDWDLSQRIATRGTLARTTAYIHHNEGELKLGRTLKKKYYYAQKIASYIEGQKDHAANIPAQTSPFSRYKLYLSDPARLLKNPVVGVGMLTMKTLELLYGGVGYVKAKNKS
jgi:hypothetical protein